MWEGLIVKLVPLSLLIVSTLVLASCSTGSFEAESSSTQTESVGFEARITGAYEGEVLGTGVLSFLPEGGFQRQGYFFLADSQGVRPHGVTFVLPRGLGVGRHELESPSPLDIGTVPSVRVDRDLGASVASYQENTGWFINLTAFPNDDGNLSETVVSGNFEFEAEDSEGEMIMVAGAFSFEVE